MNILAVEVSTSSAKAILYGTDTGVLSIVGVPYPELIGDVVSIDPEGMYEALIEAVHKILRDCPITVDAIGIASTWHSMLLLDQERRPVSQISTWADTSASPTVQSYRQDANFSKWIYQRSGCAIHSMYPLWKFVHLKRTQAEALKRTTYLSSQGEYLLEELTEQKGISRSVAAGSGFLNIHTLEWDPEILAFAGLEPHMLAPLREPDSSSPLSNKAAERLGLKAGIPVIIGGPDGALNQIGAGAMRKGLMTLSVGTSGAIRITSDIPVLPEQPSTWCYYLAEGKWIAGAATSGAGNCVEWFMKKINRGEWKYKELDTFIQNTAADELQTAPTFLPFLYGERCPGWREDREGGFVNIKGTHEIGHLYYAMLEGILMNLYQCYCILEQVSGSPDDIQISGGIVQSSIWLQMAADIFQKELHTSSMEHASTMGAVALVMKAMGVIDTLDQFKPEDGKTITPDPTKKAWYLDRFHKYQDWYEKS